MNNFMIQGGDPEGNGRGGPGYSFPDEFDPSLMHDKAGILSMANSGPATNGSQFFITHIPTDWLDNKHTVFGEVIKGIEIVDKICSVGNRPISDVIIKKLTIIRNGDDANKFDAVNVWNIELTKLIEKNRLKEEEKERVRIKNQVKGKDKAISFLPILNNYKAKSKILKSGLRTFNIIKGDNQNTIQGDNVNLYDYKCDQDWIVQILKNVKKVTEGMILKKKQKEDINLCPCNYPLTHK